MNSNGHTINGNRDFRGTGRRNGPESATDQKSTNPGPLPITPENIAEGAGETVPTLRSALISAESLLNKEIKPRLLIIGNWFKEGDYGYIFAPRGEGKTWMAMLLAQAINKGTALGEWKGYGKPRRIVYLDAEMNLADVQERARLIGIDGTDFMWLQNEIVFDILQRPLNIANCEDQMSIEELLEDGDVLFVDNLSTATYGVEENSNDDFDVFKPWLLRLRKRRISVVVIHHAGRNGQMRGGSRREDICHWILSLKGDADDGEETSFVTKFVKSRNCQATDVPPLRWTISHQEGQLMWKWKKYAGPDAMLALIRAGVGSATDLAEELGVSKGCVSKWASKLLNSSPPLIKIVNRSYVALDGPEH